MARPDKLTPEVQERIVTVIRDGNTRAAAAGYVGITDRTLYRWLAMGKNAKNGCPTSQLYQAVKEAENGAEVESVLLIRNAAKRSWQAAAWWLERRRHGEWARRDTLDVNFRQEAERVAKELGLDVEAVIAEAERIATR